MKKFTKLTAIICFVLAFALVLPVFGDFNAGITAEAKTLDELQDELDRAKAERDAVLALQNQSYNRLQETRQYIKEMKDELKALEATYYLLEEEIALLEQEIGQNEKLIAAYEKKAEYYRGEMEKAAAAKEESLVLYGELLRIKYEQGEATTMEMLFNSEDFEQLISRLQYFDNLIAYNDTVVDAIEATELEISKYDKQYSDADTLMKICQSEVEEDKASAEEDKKEMDKIREELTVAYEELIDKEEAEAKIQAELKKEADLLKEAVEDAEWAIKNYHNTLSDFGWPLAPGVWFSPTSWFGWREDPLGRGWLHHGGLDLAAVGGSHIVSVADGIVTTSAYHRSYGNYVVVYHGDGTSSLYAHMRERKVTVGQEVKRGQLLGLVGTTGDSTGNHLHFSVLVNGAYKNPDNYLPDGYYVKKYYPETKG